MSNKTNRQRYPVVMALGIGLVISSVILMVNSIAVRAKAVPYVVSKFCADNSETIKELKECLDE